MADPNPHPNKTKTLYLTKNGVKKWRDKSESSLMGQTVQYLASAIIGTACNPAGIAAGAVFLAGDQYLSIKKHKTWVKIYDNFKKDYARVKMEMKWRGYDAGYVYSGYIDAYPKKWS